MEVIVLAGGLGTRLRSAIGTELPKCMAPVASRPFLWHVFRYLSRFDVAKVIVAVGHLRNVIMDWADAHAAEFPFEIDYSVEETPLGTGGAIKQALQKCSGGQVVVLNGDTFFDVDLDEFCRLHKENGCVMSLALKPMSDFDRYGAVIVDPTSRQIKEFREKEACPSGLINGGVYCISKSDFAWPRESKFSFEQDVLEPLARRGLCHGFEFGGYFIDIGIPADYEKANADFKNFRK